MNNGCHLGFTNPLLMQTHSSGQACQNVRIPHLLGPKRYANKLLNPHQSPTCPGVGGGGSGFTLTGALFLSVSVKGFFCGPKGHITTTQANNGLLFILCLDHIHKWPPSCFEEIKMSATQDRIEWQ